MSKDEDVRSPAPAHFHCLSTTFHSNIKSLTKKEGMGCIDSCEEKMRGIDVEVDGMKE